MNPGNGTRAVAPGLAGALALAAALAAAAPPAGAQDSPPTVMSNEAFSLYTHCSDVDLLVDPVTAAGGGEFPAAETLRTAVAARLETAGILGPSRTSYLQVSSVAGPRSHAVTVWYHKALFDPHTQNAGPAATWRRTVAGGHEIGDGQAALLAALGTALDEFARDYLAVNREDCLRR